MSRRDGGSRKDAEKFLSELGWREFSYHLLYHFPTLPERNWKPAFDAFPWRDDAAQLAAWQRGRTGYPIVDAGMRELWATGMDAQPRAHGRGVLPDQASADRLAAGRGAGSGTRWSMPISPTTPRAGSGSPAAAPTPRPISASSIRSSQGRKFDPDGDYVRRWCPELARLPDAFVHAPFEAPADVLRTAGVMLGTTYPQPIVDHAAARAAALEGYAAVKAAGAG